MPAWLFDTPNSITSLRRYWKSKFTDDDLSGFIAELSGESDRCKVMLATTHVDDALVSALRRKFAVKLTDPQADKVFRNEGPLGSFSARIEMAYLTGILNEDEARQLDELREMRNACAHSLRPISFRNKQLAAVLQRFVGRPPFMRIDGEHEKDAHGAFLLQIVLLSSILMFGREEGVRRTKKALAHGLTPESSR